MNWYFNYMFFTSSWCWCLFPFVSARLACDLASRLRSIGGNKCVHVCVFLQKKKEVTSDGRCSAPNLCARFECILIYLPFHFLFSPLSHSHLINVYISIHHAHTHTQASQLWCRYLVQVGVFSLFFPETEIVIIWNTSNPHKRNLSVTQKCSVDNFNSFYSGGASGTMLVYGNSQEKIIAISFFSWTTWCPQESEWIRREVRTRLRETSSKDVETVDFLSDCWQYVYVYMWLIWHHLAYLAMF